MSYATLAPAPTAATSPGVSVKTPNKLFLFGVGLAMALSSIVLVEPAPVDALVMGLFVVGICAGIIGLRGLRPIAVVPLALFMVANVVSLYDPLNSRRALWYILVTLYLCASWAFFVGVLWAFEKRGMDLMIKMYAVAGMICIIPGLLSYFNIIGFQNTLLLFDRPKGTFKDPNVYGPYLIPIALFAVAGLIAQRKGTRSAVLHTSIALISITGIFLSYSRACWINLVVALMAYLFFSFMFRPAGTPSPFPISRAILAFAGVALCVGMAMQIPEVQEMMAQRLTSTGLQGYDKDRFATQHLALEAALAHPLGIGPGQVEEAFHYSTHSSYMRVLGENGFIGEIGYVAFVLVCLGRGIVMGWKTQDPYWEKIYFIASACILGHIINSAVVDTLHWRHYWFLLALPWYQPNALTERMHRWRVRH
ncbi:MAG TPA: O-antigen ligase family protein [Bryobacteraceae bacterium]|nr:O-antigen ligase family protein [Bryobacteraceae bacterium]